MSLHKLNLESSKTINHLKTKLENTNFLSNAIIELAPLKKGVFCTYLNEKIPFERLYDFECGGVGGSIKDKISYLILQELDNYSEINCVFDDVGAVYEENYQDSLFFEVGAHYNEEVYYLITKNKASKELLDTCFYASSSVWHSLFVLTKANICIGKDRSLKKEHLESIVLNAEMILLGCYDDESFIFWKKEHRND